MNKQIIAKQITNDILTLSDEIRKNVERAKLEHHHGKVKFTRLHSISRYADTKVDANITLWHNTLKNSDEINAQVLHFLSECEENNLPLEYGGMNANLI